MPGQYQPFIQNFKSEKLMQWWLDSKCFDNNSHRLRINWKQFQTDNYDFIWCYAALHAILRHCALWDEMWCYYLASEISLQVFEMSLWIFELHTPNTLCHVSASTPRLLSTDKNLPGCFSLSPLLLFDGVMYFGSELSLQVFVLLCSQDNLSRCSSIYCTC